MKPGDDHDLDGCLVMGFLALCAVATIVAIYVVAHFIIKYW